MSMATDKHALEQLYASLLAAWNQHDATAFAKLFTPDANVIGFDGSQMDGQSAIEETLRGIFADHRTGRYVAKVREIRMLSPGVGLLRAVCGMVPADQEELNPAVNAIHSLVATTHADGWRIALFHNTPAQFHGRAEAAKALTDELRQVLKEQTPTE